MYISQLRLNRQNASIKTPPMYLYYNSDLIDKISSIIHPDTYTELHIYNPLGTFKPYQNMVTYTTCKWTVYHRTPTTHNNHNIHATQTCKISIPAQPKRPTLCYQHSWVTGISKQNSCICIKHEYINQKQPKIKQPNHPVTTLLQVQRN